MNEEIYEREVIGEHNTFLVYLHLLRVKKASVRDVQRAVGFSSPALAKHHLEKLEGLGLAEKDQHGSYHVVPESFGVLRFFVVVGSFIIPNTIFVVALFAVMVLGFLIGLPRNWNLVWALVPSVMGLAVSIYQTIRYHRLLGRKLFKK